MPEVVASLHSSLKWPAGAQLLTMHAEERRGRLPDRTPAAMSSGGFQAGRGQERENNEILKL